MGVVAEGGAASRRSFSRGRGLGHLVGSDADLVHRGWRGATVRLAWPTWELVPPAPGEVLATLCSAPGRAAGWFSLSETEAHRLARFIAQSPGRKADQAPAGVGIRVLGLEGDAVVLRRGLLWVGEEPRYGGLVEAQLSDLAPGSLADLFERHLWGPLPSDP